MRHHAPLILLLCFGVLVTASLLLLPAADGLPPPDDTLALSADDDAPPTPLRGTTTEAAAVGISTAPTVLGGERQELPPPTSAQPSLTILVVRGAPPQPVAGASVAYVDLAAARQRHQQSRRGRVDDHDLPELYGVHSKTGADGRIRMPTFSRRMMFSAQHENDFVAARLDPSYRGEVTLQLLPDETLSIEVRDPAGAPAAGTPVTIHQGTGYGHATTIWRAATESDGLAVARHFQLYREPQSKGERFAAVLQVPLADPAGTEFAGRPAPKAPLQLMLPAHGSIELTLTDRSGTPLWCEAMTSIAPMRPKDFTSPLPLPAEFDRLRQRKPVPAGPQSFAPVGLGLQLVPNARIDGDDRPIRGSDLRGPQRPDELVRATVPLPPEYLVLAVRVLHADGRPLAGESLSWMLGIAGRPAAARPARTADDGRTDLVRRLDTTAPRQLELRSAGDAEAEGLRLQLGMLAPGERRELGVLQLEPLRLLAHGRTIDDRGTAVAGAAVRLQTFLHRDDGELFVDDPLAATSSDTEGNFVLRGLPPAASMRVVAGADGHLPAVSPSIVPGAALQLVLVRVATFAGEVLLPDWLPDGAASLQLANRDDPEGGQSRPLRHGSGKFRFDRLRPGRYDLAVRLRNHPQPLFQLADLFLAPGDNLDARLQPLDLRQSLCRYRLRAKDQGGNPLTGLEGPILVRSQNADGSPANSGFRWRQGRAELITAATTLDIVVFGKGFPPTALQLSPGDHDVFLQPLQPAIINLPGARQLCGNNRRVRVSMIFTGDTGLPQSLAGTDQRSGEQFTFPRWELGKSGGAWLGLEDTVAVPLARGGPHEVLLRLYEDERAQGRQVAVSLGVVQVVVDGPLPLAHTLPIDPRQLAAAVAELDRLRQQPPTAPAAPRGRR